MRRRTLFIVIASVVLAAILIVGVVTAGATGSSSLPTISVSTLLQNVASNASKTTAINGDFAWSNGLLGSTSLLSLGGSQTPTGLSSLLLGGSGRLWLQDGKMRLESQGQNGDLVAIVNGTTAWTWDSVTSTATKYALPTPAADTSSPMAAPSNSLSPTTAIANLIAKLAPTATLSLGDQQVVAHRDAYILKLTPTSPTTTVAAIEVAIDGQRWVPLRLQVFAKGESGAVLSAGFASVSYKPVAAGLFSFTPPSGATVAHKDLSNSLQGLQSAAAEPQAAKKRRPPDPGPGQERGAVRARALIDADRPHLPGRVRHTDDVAGHNDEAGGAPLRHGLGQCRGSRDTGQRPAGQPDRPTAGPALDDRQDDDERHTSHQVADLAGVGADLHPGRRARRGGGTRALR